jgi:5-methylcytosine-specific restriction enzyme A
MPRARRHCPGDKGSCPNLISAGERYCPDHQPEPWQGRTTGQGSTRATRAERDQCLRAAGYQCQLQYEGCTGHATHADHVENIAKTNTPRAKATGRKLQAACPWCHGIKTRREAAAARR